MAAVSEYARKRERERNREIYAWYKEHGICPRCKRTWAAPGRVCCEECLKEKRIETMKFGGEYNARKCKERRERLKAQGLCVRCAKKAEPGKVLCTKCARKNLEAQQVRLMRRRIARESADT